jgi:peptidyl-prolyl cis-trans isomerase B (cyclophilin B)
MRNASKIFLTLLAASAACVALCGCQSTPPMNAPDPSSANVTTTVTSTTTTETPKPPGVAVSGTTTGKPSTTSTPAAETAPMEALPPDDKVEQKDMPKPGEKVAVITTNFGVIVFRFLPDMAPKTVASFKKLSDQKFYDGTKFHRVIPGFMIQGGDPYSKDGATGGPPGTGGPGFSLKAEFNTTHHGRGVVSMARSQDPDSAGSQFFICVADADQLDGQYTAFGKVVKGMNVVDKIVSLPRDARDMPTPNSAVMKTVRIETWPLK